MNQKDAVAYLNSQQLWLLQIHEKSSKIILLDLLPVGVTNEQYLSLLSVLLNDK